MRSKTNEEGFQLFVRTLIYGVAGVFGIILLSAIFLQSSLSSLNAFFFFCIKARLEIAPFTGRFYSLLDPSYAKNNIPIIASVSEHQPTTWSSYYFDLQMLVFTFPGLKSCLLVKIEIKNFSWPLLLLQESERCEHLCHSIRADLHLL